MKALSGSDVSAPSGRSPPHPKGLGFDWRRVRILPRLQWSATPPFVADVIPGTQVFSFCCPPAAQALAEFCRSDAGAAVRGKEMNGS